jgi:hypothetical protein
VDEKSPRVPLGVQRLTLLVRRDGKGALSDMSDAVIGGLDATVGLIPRYLRRREEAVGLEDLEPELASFVDDEFDDLPGMRGNSMTDDLRRRIAEAAVPERRGPKPLWVGLAVVVVLAVAGLLFPDAIAALMPDVDTTH